MNQQDESFAKTAHLSSKKQEGLRECCEKCFKWGNKYGEYQYPCNNIKCECHISQLKEGK